MVDPSIRFVRSVVIYLLHILQPSGHIYFSYFSCSSIFIWTVFLRLWRIMCLYSVSWCLKVTECYFYYFSVQHCNVWLLAYLDSVCSVSFTSDKFKSVISMNLCFGDIFQQCILFLSITKVFSFVRIAFYNGVRSSVRVLESIQDPEIANLIIGDILFRPLFVWTWRDNNAACD